MNALAAIDGQVAERIRNAGRQFGLLTPAQQKEQFAQKLRRADLNLDSLGSDMRRLHALAQQAVIGFKAVQPTLPSLRIWDAVLTVLCDAHGGAHGTELSKSTEFNRILQIYHP